MIQIGLRLPPGEGCYARLQARSEESLRQSLASTRLMLLPEPIETADEDCRTDEIA